MSIQNFIFLPRKHRLPKKFTKPLDKAYKQCYSVYIAIYTVYTRPGGDIIKITLNNTSDKPMYEQIKEAVRSAILSGELSENTLLPSRPTKI